MAMGFWLVDHNYYSGWSNSNAQFLVFIGMIVEYSAGAFFAGIGYAILANQWEGYYNHKFLKFLHWLTLTVFSTIIPHGDFLLHLGYRQRGFQTRKLEEPFPDGFELPTEQLEYTGYLPSRTRGGFIVFFILGYFRCVLAIIRTALVITYFEAGSFYFNPIEARALPLVGMVLYAYASFNVLMLLKLLFENTGILKVLDCGSCFSKCCKKDRRYRAVGNRNYGEEDGIDDEII